MSDSNRVRLMYVPTTSTSQPVMLTSQPAQSEAGYVLRYTSENLHEETDTVVSQEIRSDRQVTDLIRTSIKGMGSINYEWSHGAYDNFLAYVLQDADAAFSTSTSTTTTLSATTSTVSASSGSPFSFLTAGDWVYMYGWSTATPLNNAPFHVSAVSSDNRTLTLTEGFTALTSSTTQSDISVRKSPMVRNGTFQKTIFIEKKFEDLTTEYAIYWNMFLDKWTIDFNARGVVGGSFEFLGQKEVSSTSALSTSTSAAATNSVLNTVDNVYVYEGTSTTALKVAQGSITLSNNLRDRAAVGYLGPESIGSGTVSVSGSLQLYYSDKTYIDKYLGQTATSLRVFLYDSTASPSWYLIDLPRVKLSKGDRIAGGINQDVFSNIEFTAYMHPTYSYTAKVVKVDAA